MYRTNGGFYDLKNEVINSLKWILKTWHKHITWWSKKTFIQDTCQLPVIVQVSTAVNKWSDVCVVPVVAAGGAAAAVGGTSGGCPLVGGAFGDVIETTRLKRRLLGLL